MKVGQKPKNAQNDTHSIGYWTITPVSDPLHFCTSKRVYQVALVAEISFWRLSCFLGKCSFEVDLLLAFRNSDGTNIDTYKCSLSQIICRRNLSFSSCICRGWFSHHWFPFSLSEIGTPKSQPLQCPISEPCRSSQ